MAKYDQKTREKLVDLKNSITKYFNESHWRELGLLTDHLDQVEDHGRLLRSLSFGDEDYEGHVLSMLRQMVEDDPENLFAIDKYVQSKLPELGEYISSSASPSRRITYSPNVFRVPDVEVDTSFLSVMMPFSGSFTPVYESIKSASHSAGFTCKRVDDIWNDSTIIQDVFDLIFQSYIVVCDFSGKNPNVFYEAGIAHTLGKHVIPITQSPADIPFDLQSHRYIPYLNNSEGREELEDKLASRIKILAEKS